VHSLPRKHPTHLGLKLMEQTLPVLSLLESRVLGVLIEKKHTVPDTYPLSLNTVVAGCNQKTSRDPVLNATEAEVQAALDRLKSLSLVIVVSGNRVIKFEHSISKVLQVPSQSVAILTVLMLRGPQTPGELRLNCERLHKFLDISSVEAFLNELRDRSLGALVVELPRRPGSRENRWTHLLSGEVAMDDSASPTSQFASSDSVTVSELATLRASVETLEDEVATLKKTVSKLCQELGIATN
jgi:uncharacterized protein